MKWLLTLAVIVTVIILMVFGFGAYISAVEPAGQDQALGQVTEVVKQFTDIKPSQTTTEATWWDIVWRLAILIVALPVFAGVLRRLYSKYGREEK